MPTAPTAEDPGVVPIPDAGVLVFDRDTEGFECFRIPALILAADGDLLAFAEARRPLPGGGWCDDQASTDLVLRRSSDRGHTWSPLTTVLAGDPWDRPGVRATRGNPSPVVLSRGEHAGRIVLVSTYNPEGDPTLRLPFVQHSDDHGRTWSEARDLTEQLKPDLPNLGWFATGPQHAIEITNGPHAGRLVVGLTVQHDQRYEGALALSDDGGLTWWRGAVAARPVDADHFSEVGVVERADGSLLAIGRSQKGERASSMPYSRVCAVSEDGGETFTSATFRYLLDLLTTADVQGSVLNLDAQRGAAGNILLYAAPTHPRTRKYLSVFVSTDGGRSWTRRAEVTSDRSGYSDVVMVDDTHLGVLYETGLESGDARDRILYKELWTERLGV